MSSSLRQLKRAVHGLGSMTQISNVAALLSRSGDCGAQCKPVRIWRADAEDHAYLVAFLSGEREERLSPVPESGRVLEVGMPDRGTRRPRGPAECAGLKPEQPIVPIRIEQEEGFRVESN